MTMGSRNTVPLRMLRMVPLGDFHIWGSGHSRRNNRRQRRAITANR